MSRKNYFVIALITTALSAAAVGMTIGISTLPAAAAKQHNSQQASSPAASGNQAEAGSTTGDTSTAGYGESASSGGSDDSGNQDAASASGENGANSNGSESGHAAISLFSVFEKAGFTWLLLVLLVGFLAIGHVIVPAIVWHTGKILRGGRKPSVG